VSVLGTPLRLGLAQTPTRREEAAVNQRIGEVEQENGGGTAYFTFANSRFRGTIQITPFLLYVYTILKKVHLRVPFIKKKKKKKKKIVLEGRVLESDEDEPEDLLCEHSKVALVWPWAILRIGLYLLRYGLDKSAARLEGTRSGGWSGSRKGTRGG
jgi:hypothetical protein